MAENQDASFNITFNQMLDKDQDIRALIRQRANLPMHYESSDTMYNEMTDAIMKQCGEYAQLCAELANKADSTRKPSKYAALINPPQDSSKMPSDDIPF